MYRQNFPDDPGQHNRPGAGYGADGYARRTYQPAPSFCDRVRRSLVAVVIGGFLIAVSVGITFWNEGRAVQTAQSLEEGLRHVVPLQNIEVAFEQNNGKLVHLVGPLKTDKPLSDSEYNVAIHAVRLRRNVEMFQWVEHEQKRDIRDEEGTRTEISYSYTREWRSDPIRSSSFSNSVAYPNPKSIPIEAKLYEAKDAQVGNFFISNGILHKINKFNRLPAKEKLDNENVKIYDGYFYHGKDPIAAEIGDVRVSFDYAGLSGKDTSKIGPPEKVSMIAQQTGRQLGPYQTEAGDELHMLYLGEYAPEKMFGNEQTTNTMITWALRFAGWLLSFIGFGCLTHIVTTLVDSIPVIRELVMMGVTTLNMTLSIGMTLTFIALGWIRYRPWLGCTILGFAALPFVINIIRSRTRPRPYPAQYRSLYD